MQDPTLTPEQSAAIAALLASHRAALETLLDMNAAAHVNRIARLILDGLDADARRYLRRIARHERRPVGGPYGTLGEFGENGAGPAIRDLCRQAEFHRINGAVRRAA